MRAMLGVVLACGLGAVAAGANAAEPVKDAPLLLPLDGDVVNPDWRTPPQAEDLEREYPPLAQMMQISGGAAIKCQVEIDGRLDNCHVVSEFPAGLGFGAAAIRSAVYFGMKPATIDGRPVVGSVTIPLRFQTQDAEPVLPSPIPPPTSPGALVLARRVLDLQTTASRMRLAWQPTVEQMSARVVLESQAQSGQTALDAFRQGLEETIGEQIDRQAGLMASRMTQADLQATVAYLETPAGKAWLAATNRSEDKTAQADFRNRLGQAARAHLCAQTDCKSSGGGQASDP